MTQAQSEPGQENATSGEGGAPLAEQIAARLRRAILLEELAPGARIKERDTAAEMDVSRTPLREAIRILAADGLVILRPARSPIVADPTLDELMDDARVMVALEALSGQLACERATGEDIARIRALQLQLEEMSDRATPLEFFETDMAFHRAIAEASHNPTLIDMHGKIVARLWRARFLSATLRRDRPRVLHQHADMVRALEAGDQALLRAEIDSHLQHMMRNITEIFSERAAQAAGRAAQ